MQAWHLGEYLSLRLRSQWQKVAKAGKGGVVLAGEAGALQLVHDADDKLFRVYEAL
jgi:hypothetical protein